MGFIDPRERQKDAIKQRQARESAQLKADYIKSNNIKPVIGAQPNEKKKMSLIN